MISVPCDITGPSHSIKSQAGNLSHMLTLFICTINVMAFNGEGEFHFEGKEGNVVSSNKAEMHCINFFQKLHGTL